jgi:transposase
MLDTPDFTPQMLQSLPPQARALVEQMQRQLTLQDAALVEWQSLIEHKDREIQRREREIALREAQMQKLQFELARLKRWQFGAKSEAMNAGQRRLFEETSAEDEADLQAQLARLREQAAAAAGKTRRAYVVGPAKFIPLPP